MRDSALCHIYVRAYHQNCISDNNIEPRWISEVHTNWKDTTCEEEVLSVTNCRRVTKKCRAHSRSSNVYKRCRWNIVEQRQVKSTLTLTNCTIYKQKTTLFYLIGWKERVISTHPKTFRTKWWGLWRYRFCGKLQQKSVVLIFSISWSMKPPTLQTFLS